MKPEDWQARHYLGDCFIGLQRWQEAGQEYRHVLAINPKFSWSYHNLGIVLVNLEQFEEAYQCFVKIDEQEPDFWDSQPGNFQIQQRLGNYLLEQERWEDAVIVSRRVIKLNPDFEWGHVNLKRALQGLGEFEETVSALRKELINIEHHSRNSKAPINDVEHYLDLIEKLTAEKKITKAIADQLKVNFCLQNQNLIKQQPNIDNHNKNINEVFIQLDLCEAINGYGWSTASKDGRWTRNNQISSLVFPQLNEGHYLFEMSVISEAFEGLLKSFKIYINDENLIFIISSKENHQNFPALVHGDFWISNPGEKAFLSIELSWDNTSHLQESNSNNLNRSGIQVKEITIKAA